MAGNRKQHYPIKINKTTSPMDNSALSSPATDLGESVGAEGGLQVGGWRAGAADGR